MSFLRYWYDRFRKATAGRARERLGGRIEELGASPLRSSASVAALEEELARLCQPHQDLFPATVARLGLQAAVESLRENDPEGTRRSIGRLTRWLDRPEMHWADDDAAAGIGAAIRLLLTEQPQDGAAVDSAFALFVDFRRSSDAFVAEAIPLVARVAARGRRDRAAALAYIEYLACAAGHGPREGEARVEEALRRAAVPEGADAEEINSVARDVCGLPWTVENLIELHYRKGHFAEARKIMREGGPAAEPVHASQWFRAGMIHRGLGEWSAALEHFERIGGSEDGEPFRRPSLVYGIEARFHELDERVFRGLPAAKDPSEHWRRWSEELESLLPAPVVPEPSGDGAGTPVPPGPAPRLPTDVIRGLLLQMDQRMRAPALGLRRLFGWPTASEDGELPPEFAPMFWEHAPVDSADWAVLARDSRLAAVERAHLGRCLLARGHVTWLLTAFGPFEDAEAARSSADPAADLLRADYFARTGRPAAADDLLKQQDWVGLGLVEASLGLRVDVLLAANAVAQAIELLRSPGGMALPYLTREVARAEALCAQGDWRAALEAYGRVLAVAPRSSRALNSLGWSELTLGQDAVAAECFRRVLHLQPNNHYARLGVSLASGACSAWASELLCAEPHIGQIVTPLIVRLRAAGRHDLARALATRFSPVTSQQQK